MTLEKVIKLCTSLTPVEYEIANYILAHKEQIIKISIQELADTIFVSKSAIHRFCKKIELNGFNELKVKIVQEQAYLEKGNEWIDVNYPFDEDDDEEKIAKRLLTLYETTINDTCHYIDAKELRVVTNLLHDAEMIDVYTHAHNINVAENFRDKMLTMGRSVNCPKSFYEQRFVAINAKRTHVALILSYSGKATYIEPLITLLNEKQIPMIIIGKTGCNQFPDKIKHAIYLSGKENLRDRISQFASHIALQYILDVVFGCIYNIDRKKNIEHLQKAIDFMDDRDIEE